MRAKSKLEVRIRSEARVCSEARRFATRAICETLKTRVKLNLNFTRPHAITYTNTFNNDNNMLLKQCFLYLTDLRSNTQDSSNWVEIPQKAYSGTDSLQFKNFFMVSFKFLYNFLLHFCNVVI